MRFRSTGLTGLGEDAELKGDVTGLHPVGEDLLVLDIQTTEPVKWHLRAGLEFHDIPQILKAFLKPSILLFTIRAFFYLQKNPREPRAF